MTASKLDEAAAINRRACAILPKVLAELYGYTGKPTWNITRLNEAAPQKRLGQFKIGDRCGEWFDLDRGASGNSVIDFIEWFGSCSRPAAIECLSGIVDRIERAAA